MFMKKGHALHRTPVCIHTVIRFVSISAKFGICTVVGLDHGRMNYKDTKPHMSAFL